MLDGDDLDHQSIVLDPVEGSIIAVTR